ncbi:hypothetical protein [Ferrovibrio sp.]|uniref:hypothetical protein n=1 Tax=Ferrovibrio sp. TaxID=1917215 RepID=UPI003D0E7DA3
MLRIAPSAALLVSACLWLAISSLLNDMLWQFGKVEFSTDRSFFQTPWKLVAAALVWSLGLVMLLRRTSLLSLKSIYKSAVVVSATTALACLLMIFLNHLFFEGAIYSFVIVWAVGTLINYKLISNVFIFESLGVNSVSLIALNLQIIIQASMMILPVFL